MPQRQSAMGAGWRLLTRRKAVVGWIYLANLLVGLLAAGAAGSALGVVLNQSLEADRLVNGFDLAVLIEALSRPQFVAAPAAFASIVLVVLNALLMFFITPGVAAEFLADSPLGAEEFFASCGRFFWRFVRLTLWTLLILLPIVALLGATRGALVKAAGRTEMLRLPFGVGLVGAIVIILVVLALRAWFDVALYELETSDERTTRRTLPAAWRRLRGEFGRLYRSYVASTFLMFALTAVVIVLWTRVPAARIGLTFLLMQVIVFGCLLARLWQRAAAACWFQQRVVEVTPAPVGPPEEIVPAPPLPLATPSLPEPELPLP